MHVLHMQNFLLVLLILFSLSSPLNSYYLKSYKNVKQYVDQSRFSEKSLYLLKAPVGVDPGGRVSRPIPFDNGVRPVYQTTNVVKS